MTKLDAENRYNDYLDGHTGNVAEALELLHSLDIEYVNNNYDKLKEICSVHDKSKYEEPEYTPYRKHYYPITEDEKLETEAYDNANLHHVKNNKHHWNYWLNDETGELEIPDEEEYKLYCVERCCDWLAMAGQRNQVLNEWYNANKQYIQMPDYGWEICDDIMSKVPEHYDFSFKGTRGKLDESTLHEEDIYDLEQRIIELKGKKYLDAIYSKSKGHAGYWALKKIVNSLEDKQSEKSVKTSDNGISDEEYNNIMNDLSKQKKIKHVHYDASYETDESNEEKDAIRKELGESFGNSGYVGQSKSVRAFAAEEEEKYPASECDKLLGVRSGATKAVLLPSEWHHTGSYYKETDYYDIRLLLAIKNNDEEVMSEYNEDEIKEAKQKYEDLKQWKKPELQSNTYKADVEWLTWSGTRKYPKATKHSVKNADVEERGSYYYFNDEHGIPTKKMIGSNGTRVKRIDESFKVSRGEKGYLLEANMKQLKRKTISEDPTRAKKSKHVQSKYIGISKYGVLNFETSSETHSGVKWYQEIHFPSFSGFMNIVEQGDTIDAEDVKKAMSSDNIKISCDDPSFLYWAWKYMAYRNDYGLEKETRAPKRNNTRLKGALCFTGDTEVLTSEGFKEIKDIKIGDYVFSHTGRLNKVTDTGRREAEIWNVYIDKYKIGTTEEHPFLIDGNAWVEVKDLKTNDKTTSPILKLDETITLPKDYAFMLGLYLSDGTARLKYYDHNVTKSKYKIIDNTKVFKGIDIAIDKRLSKVYNDILSKTSFEYDISESSETNNGYIHILGTNDTNLDLINFIYENGGLNHLDKYTKFITKDILNWSCDDKMNFIAGFFLGDGSFSLSGNDSLRLNICNSNKQIIDTLFILLSSMTKNVRYNISNIEGEELYIGEQLVTRKKNLYLLTVTNMFVEDFINRYPYMTQIKYKTINNEWNYSYRKRLDDNNTYFLRPIKSIEQSCEVDTVYNISVENDDSYLVTKDLISVHNCKHLYSVIELINEKRIIELIAKDLNQFCRMKLGMSNDGYQDAEGMMNKDLKANQYDYNIEDVMKTLLSTENYNKYMDGTPLEDLGLSDKEMKDIEDAIKGMRDRSQFALRSELEKQFAPAKRGRRIKRDDIKLSVGNNEEEVEDNG